MEGTKSTVSFPLIVNTEFTGKNISLFSHSLTSCVNSFVCEFWHEYNTVTIRMLPM